MIKSEDETLHQRESPVFLVECDLMARKIANPLQTMKMGQAAPLIGICKVAAADTQTTSKENQVLKRSQYLAGRYCCQAFDVIVAFLRIRSWKVK
jgi:hypothetical protein